MYYNRYKDFTQNGEIKTVPYITLADKPSDKYVVYKLGKTRMDKLSQQYYGNSEYWWVIGLFNGKPTDAHMEMGDIIKIPFPILSVYRSMV